MHCVRTVVDATWPGFDGGIDIRDTVVVKSVSTEERTRDRVRSLLLALGPSTAATLAERTGLTVAAVRRHLDALVADGTITTRTPRLRAVKRGRPARLYALTDAGHAAGPSGYDALAVSALRFMTEEQVDAFAAARGADLEARYEGVTGPDDLAARLTADGYAATTGPLGTGVQLCQHHCPVQHVATEFPQLCDAETAALGRLLDVHVQRLATIAHGDGVCTTFIPTGRRPAS
ncbi:MAG: winged helix-turn-helix transcriptional regulator [Actinobacteria bacterium]|nr:winged helix-turn-helix transcriptional regulator [Actinomycetota bacterium]MCA1721224.1 winged helix-turn-helix transcriptional regulator [Actinomycetota bacterium]